MQTVKDEIVREIEINAPIEKVWGAITQAEHLGNWFADDGATVDFRVGGDIMLRWKEHGVSWGRIEIIEELSKFSWIWARPMDVKPVVGNSTLVEFTLGPKNSGTLLRVVESGFTKLEIDPEAQSAAHAENTEGWEAETNELKAYVEKMFV